MEKPNQQQNKTKPKQNNPPNQKQQTPPPLPPQMNGFLVWITDSTQLQERLF